MTSFSTRLFVLGQALRVGATEQNGHETFMLMQTPKGVEAACTGADCSFTDRDDPASGSFLQVDGMQQFQCTIQTPIGYTEMKYVTEYADVYGANPGNYQGFVMDSFHTFKNSGLDVAGCAAKCASSIGIEATAAPNALDEQCAFFQSDGNDCWGFGCSAFNGKCQPAAGSGRCTSWVQHDGYKLYVMAQEPITAAPTSPPPPPATVSPTLSPTPAPRVLTFTNSQIIQNNIGGLGPNTGAALMHLGPVATVLGSNVSMLVSNMTPYTPWKSQVNGLNGNNSDYICFTQSCGQQVTFKFSFVDSITMSAVNLPRFRLTIADIDQGIDGKCAESVIVNGYESYVLDQATELTAEMTAAGLLVKSASRGTQADNPLSVYLNAQQKARAVQYIISGANNFTMQYKTSPNVAGEVGYAGRRLCMSGTVPALR